MARQRARSCSIRQGCARVVALKCRQQRSGELERAKKIDTAQFQLREILECRRPKRYAGIVHDSIKPASGLREHVPDRFEN